MSIAVPQVRGDCREILDGQVESLSPLRGTNLLVTGGTGFVGTWIAELVACLNDDFGFKIRLSILARGTDSFAALYPHLAARGDIRLIRSDVVFLRELPRETNWVIHAASTPDSRFHASSPVETMSTIVEGSANIIRALDPLSDFRRVIYLSSGHVYGRQPADVPAIAEDYIGLGSPVSAASAYSEAKRCAEVLFAAARTQKRLPVVIGRPFAFLGPCLELDKPWAANNFLSDALAGRPIRILGDPETVRSYMFAGDMAFWILRILTGEDSAGAWNIGSPEAVTLRRLASMVAESCSPHREVSLNSGLRFDAARSISVPDVTAAESRYGLKRRVSLPEAIEKTLRWHRSRGRTPARV